MLLKVNYYLLEKRENESNTYVDSMYSSVRIVVVMLSLK